MYRYEFLRQLDAISKRDMVKVTLNNGEQYAESWPEIKIQAECIKVKGADPTRRVRIPYENIKDVTRYTG